MKRGALAATVAATMIFCAMSLAGPLTTSPARKVTIVVVMSDSGIKLTAFTQFGVGRAMTLNPLLGPVPRGDFVSINVYNTGKKVHNFTIFGKKTRVVKPGKKAHLFVAAMTRGSFLYKSTIDKSKAFRGYLQVGDAVAADAANPA